MGRERNHPSTTFAEWLSEGLVCRVVPGISS
jgi:hypothetical protein